MTAKSFALILGVVLLAAGVVGWITGGHDHVLVVFGINMTHNLVHLVSGALAIVTAKYGEKAAKTYCLVFGLVYGLVTVAGFLNVAPLVAMLNLNMPDNLLHLAIAAACLGVGLKSKGA